MKKLKLNIRITYQFGINPSRVGYCKLLHPT